MAGTGWNRNERRSKRRYEIPLSVRYVVSSYPPARGTGHLENISSSGLLFRTGNRIPVGSTIIVEVDCSGRPVEATDTVSIVASGHVVRSRQGRVAVAIGSHFFRRRHRGEADVAGPDGEPGDMVLLTPDACRLLEAALPESHIGILRVSQAVALEMLKAGQPVALVITDRVEPFNEFRHRVHIIALGSEAPVAENGH
jgi:hypothetical protein